MWIPLALLSAALSSFRRVGEKDLASRLNHFTLGWLIQLLSLPFVLMAMLAAGTIFNPLALGLNFWLPMLIVCLGFYPLNTFLYFKAIQYGELSTVMPVYSLMPAMSLGLAWLITGEVPSLLATVGMTLIIIAVYINSLKGTSLHNPLRPFLRDRSSLYALASTANIALVNVVDKVAIKASEPFYFTFTSTLGAVVVLYVVARFLSSRQHVSVRNRAPMLASLGALQGLSYISYVVALSLGPIAQVVAVRNSQVIMGSIAGIALLREALTVQKVVALVLITIGIVILGIAA